MARQMSVWLTAYLSVHPRTHFVCPVRLLVCSSVRPSPCPCVRLPVRPPVRPSARPSAHMSTRACVRACVHACVRACMRACVRASAFYDTASTGEPICPSRITKHSILSSTNNNYTGNMGAPCRLDLCQTQVTANICDLLRSTVPSVQVNEPCQNQSTKSIQFLMSNDVRQCHEMRKEMNRCITNA